MTPESLIEANMQFWTVRAMKDTDRAYIVKSWLTTMESSSPHAKFLRLPYLAGQNRLMASQCADAWLVQTDPILEQIVEQSTVLVAVHADEPDIILAFIVGEVHATGPLLVHWVYTRSRYRGLKICNSLMTALQGELAHDGTIVATNTSPYARQQIQRRGYEQCPMFAFLPSKRFKP